MSNVHFNIEKRGDDIENPKKIQIDSKKQGKLVMICKQVLLDHLEGESKDKRSRNDGRERTSQQLAKNYASYLRFLTYVAFT